MSKFNLYKYTSQRFFKDKIIHPQFFGFKINNDYPPGEIYSKLMLTIYKPWIKNVDEFLDQNVCIPEFKYHLQLVSKNIQSQECILKVYLA